MTMPLIAITAGDFNGIGPEVAIKSVTRQALHRQCIPVLVGPSSVFTHYARLLGKRLHLREWQGTRRPPPSGIWHVESSEVNPGSIHPGTLSFTAGEAAGEAIESAVRLAVGGFVDAMVTAPVSKQALHLAGIRYPGQTEMVQHLSGSPGVAMMLVSKHMRVGLVTIHEPLARVPALLTSELIVGRIRTIHEALISDWGIRRPRLAVLALNPHAGEGGYIGTEEQRILLPALDRLRGEGMQLAGPYAADGFFARYVRGDFDAVVAMYHDQGLIPLKMSSGNCAVNVSVGLRIVRTSPDHGTGFPIAGRGEADAGSMEEAVRLAVTIARHRRATRRRSGR